MLLHFLLLVVRAHALWPAYSMPVVINACGAAVAAETSRVDAELLLAIAEHESNLEPDAITFQVRDHLDQPRRVDVLLRNSDVRVLPRRVFCGYLSAMAELDLCVALVHDDGAMVLGASEIREWTKTCSRNVRAGGVEACALRGHAGGTACALDAAACTDDQAAFAAIFMARARSLRAPMTNNQRGTRR